jgi:protein-S-isoprenylcysteine O-methyltransferase Ste14
MLQYIEETTMNEQPQKKTSILKLALFGVLGLIAFGLVLFTLAGRYTYWQGWLYLSLSTIGIIISIYVFSDQLDQIQQRIKPGPGVKWWDKIIMGIYKPLHIAVIVLACLDGGRYGWSTPLPVWVYAIGILLHLFGYVFILWPMRVNEFFSSMVRVQTEEGHYVVSDGPFQYIRHPGYLGGIALVISTALVLGSYYALIPAGLAVVLFLIRTYLEDKTLKKELPGYQEYAQTVRYRLFPGIW